MQAGALHLLPHAPVQQGVQEGYCYYKEGKEGNPGGRGFFWGQPGGEAAGGAQ